MPAIRDIMTAPVVCIDPETTLAEAVEILTKHHIGSAPVVSADQTLLGIISDLQLIDVTFDADARNRPVDQYMTREVHTVHPDDSLARAAQFIALYSIRRVPVVEDDKLVGIVARRDLMNFALRTGVTLREPLSELIPEMATMS